MAAGTKRWKLSPLRPNFFVGVRIEDNDLLTSLRAVQESILARECKMSRAMVKLSKTHVTLLVLRLDTPTLVERAQSALGISYERALSDDVTEMARTPLKLNVNGLSHFGHKVLFADFEPDSGKDRLLRLQGIVRDTFRDELPEISFETRQFTPHLTLFKMSQKRIEGVKKISPDWYHDMTSREFGHCVIGDLQLLKMSADSKEEEQSEYYESVAKFEFKYKK